MSEWNASNDDIIGDIKRAADIIRNQGVKIQPRIMSKSEYEFIKKHFPNLIVIPENIHPSAE